MRKLFLVCAIAIMGVGQVSAQDYERGIFNHLGANLSVGTEGIGVGIAAPCTDYLEFGLGINFFPNVKVKGDVSIGAIYTGVGYTIPSSKVKIEGAMARTMMDFKVNAYPFGGSSSFFVAAGFSFGGKKMFDLSGHSDAIAEAIRMYPELENHIYAEIDKYNVHFDKNGDVAGDVRVKNFRPYVGLGFGRLVPKNRVGFRFELGCQFMGKMKVYQNDSEVDTSELNKADDDLSKWVDRLKVYPVLKFTLTGRLF